MEQTRTFDDAFTVWLAEYAESRDDYRVFSLPGGRTAFHLDGTSTQDLDEVYVYLPETHAIVNAAEAGIDVNVVPSWIRRLKKADCVTIIARIVDLVETDRYPTSSDALDEIRSLLAGLDRD